MQLSLRLQTDLDLEPNDIGVIVVDHGSRRDESNQMLNEIVAMFRRVSGMPIIEPAHMELAEPSIADAFASCVEQGAQTVVVFPFFLAPGRHWTEDIPRLSAEAAASFPKVRFQVTSPLGPHELMGEVMSARVQQCLHRALKGGSACAMCNPTGGCNMQTAAMHNED